MAGPEAIDKNAGVEVLAGAVFGTVLTLIAGYAAAVVTARRDHEKWLRAERLQAYSFLLSAVFECEDPINISAVDLQGAGARDPAKRPERLTSDRASHVLIDLSVELSRRLAQVLLVGPASVEDPAHSLHDHCKTYVFETWNGSGGTESTAEIAAFVAAARHGLNSKR